MHFLNILVLVLLISESYSSSEFDCQKDTFVSIQFNQSYLIGYLKAQTKYICMSKCNSLNACMSVSYNYLNGACFLFNNSANTSNVISLQSYNLYSVKFVSFNQSCTQRKCIPNIGLTCINNLCECSANGQWSMGQCQITTISPTTTNSTSTTSSTSITSITTTTTTATTTTTTTTSSSATTITTTTTTSSSTTTTTTTTTTSSTTTTTTTTTTSTTTSTGIPTTTVFCPTGTSWDGFECVSYSVALLNGTVIRSTQVTDDNGYTLDPRQTTCMLNGSLFFYYVTDYKNNLIAKYDQTFKYKSQKTVNGAFGILAVGSDLYVSSLTDATIYKMNSLFTIVKSVVGNVTTPELIAPKQIVYDSSSDSLYVGGNYTIYKFDRNLVLLDYIDMSAYFVSGLNVFNGVLYSANINRILKIENKVITATYSNLCSSSTVNINSIYFPSSQYIYITCDKDDSVKVLKSDFTYAGKSFSASSVIYVDVDPLGRLIACRVIDGFVVFYF